MGLKATKVKFIPLSGDEKYPVPASPIDQDGNMLKPAVTFNANRIAYADGVKVDNGDIYETLLNINTECLATSAADLQSGVDPKFMANTFAMISRTNTDIMINSFCNSLTSHYCVFASRVNMTIDKLLGDRADSIVRKLDTEYAWYNHDRYLSTAIDRLMNCSLVKNIGSATNDFIAMWLAHKEIPKHQDFFWDSGYVSVIYCHDWKEADAQGIETFKNNITGKEAAYENGK